MIDNHSQIRKNGLPILALAIILTAGTGTAEDKGGSIAHLPSKPGPHIEKIKALGDNEWLNLGAPQADPKWGKGRASAWGAKAMVLAPERRGAFLYGEGVHAYVKPDGHIMDDLWFYDINAHAWICLYPGMNTKTLVQRVKDKELTINDDGLLVDNGELIPLHPLVHAWGFLSYDSDRHKFAFLPWGSDTIPRYFLGNEKEMEEGLQLLEAQLKDKPKLVFSPWYYDEASGKFERTRAKNAEAIGAGGFPQLHYLPSRKQFFAVGSSTVAIFDPATNEWTDAKPKGPQPKGYDACGCYDSKRNRIYRNDGDGGEGEGLMAYDIGENTWMHLKPKGTSPAPANTNAAYFQYDPRLDLVIAIHFHEKTPGVFVYDPSANAWSGPLPFPEQCPKFPHAANTCFDPELNAFFCHTTGDSRDDGEVWVYRYKK